MAKTVPLNRKPGIEQPKGVPAPKQPEGSRPTPYWRKLLLGEWEEGER